MGRAGGPLTSAAIPRSGGQVSRVALAGGEPATGAAAASRAAGPAAERPAGGGRPAGARPAAPPPAQPGPAPPPAGQEAAVAGAAGRRDWFGRELQQLPSRERAAAALSQPDSAAAPARLPVR